MSVQVLVRIPEQLAARLDRAAAVARQGRQDVIRELLDAHLPPAPAAQLDGQLTIGDDAP